MSSINYSFTPLRARRIAKKFMIMTMSVITSIIITYICINWGQELVGVLVVVLTGVGHDPVEHGLLLLLFSLLIVLASCLLYQVDFGHLNNVLEMLLTNPRVTSPQADHTSSSHSLPPLWNWIFFCCL